MRNKIDDIISDIDSNDWSVEEAMAFYGVDESDIDKYFEVNSRVYGNRTEDSQLSLFS